MSKGYPTREQDDEYPILDNVLPANMCIICKRRPKETASGECSTCYAALHAA